MALVCRRFRLVTCTPQLLRDVQVKAEGSDAALSIWRVLLPWLMRHAVHMQRLKVHLPLEEGTEEDCSELAGLVTGCLAACGAAAAGGGCRRG